MTCPTVKIEADNEQGFIVINEADFDGEKMSIWVETQETQEKPKKKRADAGND